MSASIPRFLVATVLLATTTSPSIAEDSVLGLPTPRDARRPGAILLYGGSNITNDAWDEFIALAGGREARIVFVPSAGYRPSDYDSKDQFDEALRTRFRSWVRLAATGQVASMEFLHTDDPADSDSDAFVQPLTKATAVWFSGGIQSRLAYRYVGREAKGNKFQAALRDVIARGGIVGGTSAGMAVLPELMTTGQERVGLEGPQRAVVAPGLGLFSGAIVEQHFNGRSGRMERFTGLLRDADQLDNLTGRKGSGAKMLGLAVDESTGLLLRGDRLQVVGNSSAHVFLKTTDTSTTWHSLKPGTKAELKRDRRGEVTLEREAAPR